MRKVDRTSWSYLIFPLIALAGCVTPTESNAPGYFIDAEMPHGTLQVSRLGCLLTKPQLMNTSKKSTGFTYHSILILSPQQETVAHAEVNCPSTVPGGSTNCLIQSVVILKPTLACTNWHSWHIQLI